MFKANLELQKDKSFARIRAQKILNYATKQAQKSFTDKEKEFEVIDEYQHAWVDHRMKGSARSWARWNGVIEVWEPWNRYGEPVNIWRYYKK
jgi:hypothetical protein